MRLDDQVPAGERIAYYRKRQGMMQEVLRGLVGGRTTEWLRQIENGHKDVDKLSTIVAVADTLRLNPIELLPGPFRTKHGMAAQSALRPTPCQPSSRPCFDMTAWLA